MKKKNKIRTSVYIDGFNLYYGSLKNTPYRWLDLKALCQNILPAHHEIKTIRYFIARVSGTPEDPGKSTRQDVYLQALKQSIPELAIHYGRFQRTSKRMPLVHPNEKPHGVIANKKVAALNKEIFNNKDGWNDGPGPCVDVLSTEEKGSDVNLAVHLVNDAWNNAFECAVILSNDSDLAEAMFLVKNRGKKLGLITSTNRPTKRLVNLIAGVS